MNGTQAGFDRRAAIEDLRAGPGAASGIQLRLLQAAAKTLTIAGDALATRWLRRATAVLEHLFDRSNSLDGRLFHDRSIRVPLADRYWVPFLLVARDYEPEVRVFLDRVLTRQSVFVDCGSNIGWWSIYASTIIPDEHRILAIEPDARAFASLTENRSLNEDRFECLRGAVTDVADETVPLLTAHNRPASATLGSAVETGSSYTSVEYIRSIRLDDLIESRFAGEASKVVVKLDVEGVEIRALEGAGRYLRLLPAIVYEDHGRDRESVVSRQLLDWGFQLFTCDGSSGLRRIDDLEQVLAIKRDPGRGYNFLAARAGSAAFSTLHSATVGKCAS